MREPSELAMIGAAAVEHGELKRKLTALQKTLSSYRDDLRLVGSLMEWSLPPWEESLDNFETFESIPTSATVIALLSEIQNTRDRIRELEEVLRAAGCAPDDVQHALA